MGPVFGKSLMEREISSLVVWICPILRIFLRALRVARREFVYTIPQIINFNEKGMMNQGAGK
jgi:hypothetical protein